MEIQVDTDAMIEAAQEIARCADLVEEKTARMAGLARAELESKRILGLFQRPDNNVARFEHESAGTVSALRAQSLFLKECARRYRSVQSVSVLKAEKLDREKD